MIKVYQNIFSFIREGKALKQCRKGTSERVLLLFSDIFVYVQARVGHYLVPGPYRLSYLRFSYLLMHPNTASSLLTLFSSLNINNKNEQKTVDKSKTENGKPTIYFYAPRISFILIFSSIKERDSWFETFTEAIESSKSNLIVYAYLNK